MTLALAGAHPAGLEQSERAGGSGAALPRPHPAPWLSGWATAGRRGVVLQQQVRPKARGLLPARQSRVWEEPVSFSASAQH